MEEYLVLIMVSVDELKNAVASISPTNLGLIAAGVGVTAIGGGLVASSILGSKRKKKTSKGRARDRKFKSKQKHEVKYKRKRKYKVYKLKRKMKSKSRKGVKYTKNGQPYIILANGRARFIKGKRRAK